jgi:hypothetical protein
MLNLGRSKVVVGSVAKQDDPVLSAIKVIKKDLDERYALIDLVIQFHDSGYAQQYIADLLGISRMDVRNIIYRYCI